MTGSTIELVRTPKELRELTRKARRADKVVGFVPTMGALHKGHLRLVEVARERADLVIVSIFVNPTQFGPKEDLDRYPRDLEGDMAKCADAGAEVVFAPAVEHMYPDGAVTHVTVPHITAGLCGKDRPTHFGGVATIVSKLFNIVGPCVAVFGRKDFQQLTVIRRMAADLYFDVDVVGVPTVREADGVALSSRNAYLTENERSRARALVRGLSAACEMVTRHDPARVGEVRSKALSLLESEVDSVDYVELCDPETLETLDSDMAITSPTLLAVAARLGKTRLIDNVVLLEQSDPLE
jgi:pantoate--beta-alanine ligase